MAKTIIPWLAEDLAPDSVYNEVTGKNVQRLPQDDDFICIGGYDQGHIRFYKCVSASPFTGWCQLEEVYVGPKFYFSIEHPEEYRILEKGQQK